jgi:hypothetical protein
MGKMQKQKPSGWRYAGLIILLLALGGCGQVPFGEEAAEETLPDGWVRVQVPLPQGEGRFLSEHQAKELIDYYEVVFKNTADTKTYLGSAKKGEQFLSLAIPAGPYDVQLLAGSLQNGSPVLLAAAQATGKDIIAGQTNTVPLTLSPLKVVSDNYVFNLGTATNLMGPTGTPDGKPIRKDTVAYVDDSTASTKLPAATGNLTVEVKVEPGAGLPTTLFPDTGVMAVGTFKPYNEETQSFTPYLGSSVAGTTGGVFTFLFPIKETAAATPDITKATPINGDWLFDFTIEYFAFNTTGTSSKWIIRNGLTGDLDKSGGLGGGVLVRFGSGSNLPPTTGEIKVQL